MVAVKTHGSFGSMLPLQLLLLLPRMAKELAGEFEAESRMGT